MSVLVLRVKAYSRTPLVENREDTNKALCVICPLLLVGVGRGGHHLPPHILAFQSYVITYLIQYLSLEACEQMHLATLNTCKIWLVLK